jgi:hypothetical protein
MINLTPFLLFDGNCAEAVTFYKILAWRRVNSYEGNRHSHQRPNAAGTSPQDCHCGFGTPVEFQKRPRWQQCWWREGSSEKHDKPQRPGIY